MMRKLRPGLAALVIGGMIAVAAVAPVAAAGPVITKDSPTFGDAPYRDCGAYTVIGGPIHLQRTFLRWYDETGALTLERRHVQFAGTLRNSVTGESIPYAGKFMRTLDAASGELTLTGVFRLSVGDGLLAPVSAGREVVDLSDGELIFRAGPASFDDVICEILG